MKVQSVAIDSIKLDPENVRLHPERNLGTIKASLQKYGQQKPIVVGPDGICIAGNGTLEAARELGWDKIAITRSKLVGAEARAYALVDNRSSDLSTWDYSALGDLVEQLEGEDDFDFADVGFSKEELSAFLSQDWEPVGNEPEEAAHEDGFGGGSKSETVVEFSVEQKLVIDELFSEAQSTDGFKGSLADFVMDTIGEVYNLIDEEGSEEE